jgi:hypothetical protein
MIGVSPSFIFSKYTTDFSVDDYIDSLSSLKELKVDCFQGEIFKRANIKEWSDNASKLAAAYKNFDLQMSSFVAHFLINYTKDFNSLFDEACFDEIRRVCELVKYNFVEEHLFK